MSGKKFRETKIVLKLAKSDGLGSKNPSFEFWKCHVEMSLRKVEEGFSSFFAYFIIFLNEVHQRQCESLKNYQICQKMKKSLVQLALLKPIFGSFWVVSENLILDVPDPSLQTAHHMY